MPGQIPFNNSALLELAAPSRGPDGAVVQDYFWDENEPAFGVRVSSTGRKTWVLAARVNGRQKRFTLGDCALKKDDFGLSLADARSKANELRKAARAGVDLVAQRKEAERKQQEAERLRREAERLELASRKTFESAVAEFLDRCRSQGLKAGTVEQYEACLTGKDFAEWRTIGKTLKSITRADIRALLAKIELRGKKVMRDRTLATLRSMLGWAAGEDYIETSPADYIENKAGDIRRKRHLFGNPALGRPSEIGLAWRAFDAADWEDRPGSPKVFRAFFQCLLLLGQRKQEVAQMRHSELLDLDGEDPRWHLPDERSKNGCGHVLPLPALAVEAIKSLPRVKGCPYVFSLDGKKHIVGIQKAKRRVDAEYPGWVADPWRIHDLRRTFKTGLAALRVDKEVRDALLNHAAQGLDSIYVHADRYQEQRDAMTKWEAHVRACIAQHDAKNQMLAAE